MTHRVFVDDIIHRVQVCKGVIASTSGLCLRAHACVRAHVRLFVQEVCMRARTYVCRLALSDGS